MVATRVRPQVPDTSRAPESVSVGPSEHDHGVVSKRVLLVEIDPRDYQVAAERVQARLELACAQVASAEQDYAAALANVKEEDAASSRHNVTRSFAEPIIPHLPNVRRLSAPTSAHPRGVSMGPRIARLTIDDIAILEAPRTRLGKNGPVM
jgi:hypothetical protein